ncbi:MAG: LysM peptidoglycan-binding domain-containing protein [Patescibacteria group bacterium]
MTAPINIPLNIAVGVIVVFGFLTGSTLYFYNQSRPTSEQQQQNSQQFSGEIPGAKNTTQPDKVDKLTKPADPKGRVTYPANVYTVGRGETLFGIGVKVGIDWQLIVMANGLENENVVQTGKQLVIPKLSTETDYYRVHFTLSDELASEKNRELRDQAQSDFYDPIKVAQLFGQPYFGIAETDGFTLLEQDTSQGTALVQAKSADQTNVVGLFQPKQKGDRGFWAILYIESHE